MLAAAAHLTDRDHTLLGWLADHGVLTTVQIAAALFPSLDFAQRRLRTLTGLELLARFRPLKLDGGSHPYHYVLAPLGAHLVAVHRGEPPPRPAQARARMRALTARANLPHLLGVNQFFTDLAAHARTHPNAHLHRWWPTTTCTRMGAFTKDDDDALVRAYRPLMRPDGHGVYSEHSRTVAFFLEHDTGSEDLPRLVAKLPRYGAFTQATGHRWPVLFHLHDPVREDHLHRLLAREAPPVVPVATTVGTHDPISYVAATAATDPHPGCPPRACPAEAHWWLHGHPGARLCLADLPGTPPAPR
ncbi:MAG: hypothetical protein GXX79_02660 [Actinomycetales bacterium]|nr:hypothetical protein [Actinomycetales bacterium]